MTPMKSLSTTGEPDEDFLLLNALLDGELDAARAHALERRMEAEPALAESFEALRALQRRIRDELPPMPADAALARRVTQRVLPFRERTVGLRALAAAMVLSVGLGGGLTAVLLEPTPGAARLDGLVDGHVRSLLGGQPIDVASSDRHTVKPWLAGKLPRTPLVPDLSADGFALLGGRVDVVGGTPVPTLVYRRGAHLISLAALPAGQGAASARERGGYGVRGWSEDGFDLVAISDVASADLAAFEEAYRKGAAAVR